MIRKQYHGHHTADGILVWDVRNLLQQAQSLPVEEMALDCIAQFDEDYWYQTPDNVPTCRHITDHMKLVIAASLDYPIILCADGRLMDGMHRVAKAHIENRTTIRAQRFLKTPPPDFVNVGFEELSYQD